VSQEFDQYLTGQLQPLARDGCVQRNAQFAWIRHGRHFPTFTDAAILEIGPGYGAMLELLCNEHKYADVHGVDISPEVVGACNRIVPNSTELTDDTTAFLCRRPKSYDLILMLHILEHVPRQGVMPLLTAVKGALKPGGKLVVEVPNIAHPLTGLYHRYHDFTHTVGFTDQSLGFVLRTAGFETVVVYPCKIPRTSALRALQRASQDTVELAAKLLLRFYMPQQSVILSSVLGACAAV
jgi:2-polyprenyl-3-methyl-5-hydroxy-6-metoxy-1,4-benzoquinol methylase